MNVTWEKYLNSLEDGGNEEEPYNGVDYQEQSEAVLGASSVISSLTQYRLIHFTGEDAQNFLQNQLSSDIREVTDTQSQYSCYSTAKGRMIASFLVWRWQGGYFLLVASDIAEMVYKRMLVFILRAKVKVKLLNDEFALIGIKGEVAEQWGQDLTEEGIIPSQSHQVVGGSQAMLVRLPSGAIIVVLNKEVRPSRLPNNRVTRVGAEAWSLLDIRAGIPWVTHATQELFVAQMANMDLIGAVSFKKGCYPGQEIVARTQYLGKLKRRLYRVEIPGMAKPGDVLLTPPLGQQSIGTVVNVARVNPQISEALAVIQQAAWETGIFWGIANSLPLSLLPLPYPLSNQ